VSDITVLIPSSPIQLHPDTKIIDECISSVRSQLPDSEIIITVDGIRPEQEYLRKQYTEYTKRLIWKCLHEWDNVMPIIYKEHLHQSGMLNQVINQIKTPLVLYVEHDTPIVPDLKINWQECIDMIYSGEANTIRYHFENVLPKEHEVLMLGTKGHFLKTYQWSQRPHLTSKNYLEYMLKRSFNTDKTRACFIEDIWHGIVYNDYMDKGMLGWFNHRLWIYAPKGGLKRSYNLDGRGEELKYKQSFEL